MCTLSHLLIACGVRFKSMQHTPSQSAWIAASSARLDVQVAHGTGGDARQEALADAGQQLGGDGGQEGQELPEQLGGTGGDLGGAAALHAHHAVGACVACEEVGDDGDVGDDTLVLHRSRCRQRDAA
eukprot:CAMPEP_0206144650 /NCGR_PEP_ID=MMETSP1473-20131121/24755_1 /ASSEMBLY_ACC=CAM_ASM_001109 /TAXON_ID=1461547 /ORGANISM="Stichococcus sp, Strain RCC1054" /LENGTH=126 /DNA_ID=CAMNT_0053540525 /DNA_START=175 /DNA_END=552 /DNA_ORIENTATION=+